MAENKKTNDESEYLDDSTVQERLTDIEKKVNITLVLMVILIIIGIALIFGVFGEESKKSYTSDNTNTQDSGESVDSASYSTDDFKEISASGISSESKNETIVIMIGRQGCGYCAAYAPIITATAKEFGITVRYIDLAKIIDFSSNPATIIDNTSYNTLINLSGSGEWKDFAKNGMGGTPLTLIVKNNKVVGGIQGSAYAEDVEEAFTNAGLSK